MPDAANFDESVRRALEAAVDATGSSPTPAPAPTSPLSPSSLAVSPAFFEALCGACRHAPPLEVVRAADGEQGEGEPGEQGVGEQGVGEQREQGVREQGAERRRAGSRPDLTLQEREGPALLHCLGFYENLLPKLCSLHAVKCSVGCQEI